jgi:hypothetical protein
VKVKPPAGPVPATDDRLWLYSSARTPPCPPYLVFNEGYSGDIDLAAEAIRLTRQLAASTDEPEVSGLLALMLLHHARRASRTGPGGRLVPLAEQDRSHWDTGLIAEGVAILQTALARDRLGEYQAQAAIAAGRRPGLSAARSAPSGIRNTVVTPADLASAGPSRPHPRLAS